MDFAEQLLCADSNLLRVLERSPEGMLILDLDGMIRFVNPAAERLFCRPKESLLNEHFGYPIQTADTTEIQILSHSNTSLTVHMRIVELDAQEQGAYLVSLHDITDQKRIEEALRHTLEIKSQFISMASHELRTPLTAIQEGVRFVAEQEAETPNPEQKELLELIQRNVQRLSRIINDVLDLQKLENEKVEFRMVTADLNELVKEIVASMKPAIDAKGLMLRSHYEQALPSIPFDRDRIAQVLTNLLNNATKFTEKGCITVSTQTVGDQVRVAISDTGRGVSQEDLPRLFQQFEQLSNVKERIPGGTGLGLCIAREIVHRHHGEIKVTSSVGHGSTFTVCLPIEGSD